MHKMATGRRFEWGTGGITTKHNKTLGLSRSYRVRAGELAGDVECDQIFSNNYVGHSVAVVGHLETTKNHCQRTVRKTPTKRASVVINSLDRILRRLPHI